MFSNKMDFSPCVIWIDFYKSGHIYIYIYIYIAASIEKSMKIKCNRNYKFRSFGDPQIFISSKLPCLTISLFKPKERKSIFIDIIMAGM